MNDESRWDEQRQAWQQQQRTQDAVEAELDLRYGNRRLLRVRMLTSALLWMAFLGRWFGWW